MDTKSIAVKFNIIGIDDKFYVQLDTYMDGASSDWLNQHAGLFIKSVNQEIKKFNLLARFIGKGGELRKRCECLRVTATHLTDKLDLATIAHLNLDNWALLCGRVEPLVLDDRNLLRSFCGTRKISDLLGLIFPVGLVGDAAAYASRSLVVLLYALRNGGDPKWLSGDSMKSLVALFDAGRTPKSGFHSFTQWGAANYNTVQENIDGHFLKHVCAYSNKMPAEAVFPSEAAWWWKKFDLSLRYDQVLPCITDPGDRNALQSFFTKSGDIDRGKLESFLKTETIKNSAQLQSMLIGRGADIYRKYALSLSKVMATVAVTCSSGKAFVCGYHLADEIFICGRIDVNGFGISSCYKSLNLPKKMKSDEDQRMWLLRA